MEDVSRYVNIAFIVAALILSWIFMKSAEVAMVSFGEGFDRVYFGISMSSLIGVGLALGITAYYYWMKPRAYELATEVAVELSKVSWPDAEDTKKFTYVVTWFAIVVAGAMTIFDGVWKYLTDLLLTLPH